MVPSLVGLRLRPGGAHAPRGLGAGERAASAAHQRRDDARRNAWGRRHQKMVVLNGFEWDSMMFVMGFYGVLMVLMVYQWCFMVF